MFRTALTTHALTVGLAALSFWMPPAILAQLPDAPSAVMMARKTRTASPEAASMDENSSPEGGEFAVIPAFDASQVPEILPGDSVSGAAGPREYALNDEPVAAPQQSFSRPGKQNSGPGFSSSVGETRPVPGSAPALRNACPSGACGLAESVMCCGKAPPAFTRYLKSPDAVPLNARANLRSAVKGIIDPFNLLTIVADAAIGVASDSHSVYGPGLDGISKYAGVSLTEDMTGEFFGTFLVPSLMHQDPHYHREPFMPIKHRIFHAIVQVVWAQSYTGSPMLNYANIVGGIATAAVSNTFVPGPGRQGVGPTAGRLAEAFAISPSGNLIEEFLPDIASRINLRIVIFQRILNTVTIEESGGIQ